MLPAMDLDATSAGAWLVLGTVLGILLAGLVALAAVGLRPDRRRRAAQPTGEPEVPSSPAGGWAVDDLPAFLESPPGSHGEGPAALPAVPLNGGPALLDAPHRPTTAPAPAAPHDDRAGRRLLGGLLAGAVVLVGAAAALAATTAPSRGTAPEPRPGPADPSWTAPDVSGVPAQPSPGDPGAGRLALRSVPVGPDGALARGTFGGLLLERRAVGVTVAYPTVSLTASEVPDGPALAHVRLPVWNCLTDNAPADPAAAGCRRLPAQHAELGTPALTISSDGEGLRISGRFPTYLRPVGSPPAWTGQVYPLAVTWTSAGATVHVGAEQAFAVEDPALTELRTG